MEKKFVKAEDIVEDLGIDIKAARQLIGKIGNRIELNGGYYAKGVVPVSFYNEWKNTGFVSEDGKWVEKMPITEKRLMSLEEFCDYAGGIGMSTARKYIRKIGVEVRIGGRSLVDRVKFDRWCDEHSSADI